jgi:DNA repair protein RadC
MASKFRCSGDTIPAVKLAFAKEMCLRGIGKPLSTPVEVAEFVSQHYGCKPQEVFLAIHLNPRNEPVYVHEISLGGLNITQVDPKVLFSGALLSGASSIILVHNHPSGDPEPSQSDVAMTNQMMEAAKLLAVNILDHIIVARGAPLRFTSLRSRGLLGKTAALGDEEIHYGAMAPPAPVVEP